MPTLGKKYGLENVWRILYTSSRAVIMMNVVLSRAKSDPLLSLTMANQLHSF